MEQRGAATARAGELIHQVAGLGGRVDSLMEVGALVIDGDGGVSGGRAAPNLWQPAELSGPSTSRVD